MATLFLILFILIVGVFAYFVIRGIIRYLLSIVGYWMLGKKMRSIAMAVLAVAVVCSIIFWIKLILIAGIAVLVFGVLCDKKPIIYYYS